MLSVVVPCYNEENALIALCDRLAPICRHHAGDNFEIILIDDGSSDKTWATMNSLAQKSHYIVLVRLARNFGHQLALKAGLEVAQGDRFFIIDADLQDPPELLGEMVKALDNGADIAYGKRVARTGETLFKKASAALFYRVLNRLTDIEIPLDTGDFRLMNKKALGFLKQMPEQKPFVRGMVSWIGLNQVGVNYQRDARVSGETGYSFRVID